MTITTPIRSESGSIWTSFTRLSTLESDSVDLVVTDPPYASLGNSKDNHKTVEVGYEWSEPCR